MRKENKPTIVYLGDTKAALRLIAKKEGDLSLSAMLRRLIIEKEKEMGV